MILTLKSSHFTILMKKLVLFDIDGTLLRVQGVSRKAITDSLEEVFGTSGDAATHDFSGKLDSIIITELMRGAGFSDAEIAGRYEAVKHAYITRFKAAAKPEHIRLMPGVTALLDALAQRGDVVLALLTGNFEAAGRHKLALPDIERYFSFGAFADDIALASAHRNHLPPVAVDRAEKKFGKRFEGKEVVVIGDTVHDVACAAVLGSRSIAVATGNSDLAVLRTAKPDVALETLSDTEAVIELILE